MSSEAPHMVAFPDEELTSVVTFKLDPNSIQRRIWKVEESDHVLGVEEFSIQGPEVVIIKKELITQPEVVYRKLYDMLAPIDMASDHDRSKLIRHIIERARARIFSEPNVILSMISVELYITTVNYYLELTSDEVESADMVPAAKSAIAGLEKGRLKDMVTIRYFNFEDYSCTICMKQMEVESVVTAMPCSHKFHSGCIEKWLNVSHYCPICRLELDCSA